MNRKLIAVLLVLAVSGTPLLAQGTEPPKEDLVDIDWNGVTLENLIVMVSNMTGRVMVYDREALKAKPPVTLSRPQRIPEGAVYAMFETVMKQNGLALVTLNLETEKGKPTLEVVQVIKREEGAKSALEVSDPSNWESVLNRDQMITQVIPLKYASARDILAPAQALLSDPRNVLASETLNSIIITDYATNVRRVMTIIQMIDRKQQDVELEVVALKYASATELEPKLNQLVQTLQRAQPPRPGVPVPQQEQVSIGSDFRTNSLIVLALPDRMVQIKNMISKLDIVPEKSPTNLHVYRLKHARAEELATVLQAVFGGGSSGTTRQPAGGGRAGTGGGAEAVVGGQSTPPNQQVQVSITADKQNNALVVVATPEVWEPMEVFISELDRRRPQVIIETAIIEVTGNDQFDLGVELANAGTPADGRTRGFLNNNLGLGVLSDTDGDDIPDIKIPNSDLSGITAGIFRGAAGKLPILLHALSEKRKINVVSLPQITTNDNEQATLTVNEIVTTAATTTTTGVVTTSSGTQTQAGITMKVTPHISADNYLQLEIDLQVSQFQARPTANSAVPPPITNRSVITKVTLPNTHTVVVGGLVTDQLRETVTGIPILQDIPILGQAFERTVREGTKTTLYVFITPIILSDPTFTDFKRITLRKQEAMFQTSKRWVGMHQLGEHEPNAADLFEYRTPFGTRGPGTGGGK
ncbi:MAG: type II secretion system secretin GspD [Candidatus Brocadiae bacterium]|nr:type II secretion system secretin GspD [Candidatus Brocadiia bacterium]